MLFHTVKMKIGEGSGKAMLSGGWAQAADYIKLKEGEIYMFSFSPSKRHVLEIMLVQIWVAINDPGMSSELFHQC